MLSIEEMQEKLAASIPGKRYKHSLNVYETAMSLCRAHGVDSEKIAIAALLHDCGRVVKSKESIELAQSLGLDLDAVEINQPVLIHAKLGMYYAAKDYGVEDQEILAAIGYHTTGAANMSTMAKIVYLADMLEPQRDFPGVDKLRQLAAKDLDQAMLAAYKSTMEYLLAQGLLLHPRCLEGYNQLVLTVKE